MTIKIVNVETNVVTEPLDGYSYVVAPEIPDVESIQTRVDQNFNSGSSTLIDANEPDQLNPPVYYNDSVYSGNRFTEIPGFPGGGGYIIQTVTDPFVVGDEVALSTSATTVTYTVTGDYGGLVRIFINFVGSFNEAGASITGDLIRIRDGVETVIATGLLSEEGPGFAPWLEFEDHMEYLDDYVIRCTSISGDVEGMSMQIVIRRAWGGFSLSERLGLISPDVKGAGFGMLEAITADDWVAPRLGDRIQLSIETIAGTRFEMLVSDTEISMKANNQTMDNYGSDESRLHNLDFSFYTNVWYTIKYSGAILTGGIWSSEPSSWHASPDVFSWSVDLDGFLIPADNFTHWYWFDFKAAGPERLDFDAGDPTALILDDDPHFDNLKFMTRTFTEGQEGEVITAAQLHPTHATWSPTSDAIAFFVNNTMLLGPWVVGASGSNPHHLMPGASIGPTLPNVWNVSQHGLPIWSPQGDMIALVGMKADSSQPPNAETTTPVRGIWTVTDTGTNPQLLVADTDDLTSIYADWVEEQ